MPEPTLAQQRVPAYNAVISNPECTIQLRVLTRADLVAQLPQAHLMDPRTVVTIKRQDLTMDEADFCAHSPVHPSYTFPGICLAPTDERTGPCECGSTDGPDEESRCPRCGTPR